MMLLSFLAMVGCLLCHGHLLEKVRCSMTSRSHVACSQLLSLENMIWQTTGRLSLREDSAGRREPSRGGRY
jgi:hypothetical protein